MCNSIRWRKIVEAFAVKLKVCVSVLGIVTNCSELHHKFPDLIICRNHLCSYLLRDAAGLEFGAEIFTGLLEVIS